MWHIYNPQSTLICAAPPQDCLYLVFELCEGLDLLETIRRSKNGRRFARLGKNKRHVYNQISEKFGELRAMDQHLNMF